MMMKKLFMLLLFVLCHNCFSQKNLRLSDGLITYGEIKNSPERTIEIKKDGIIVHYVFKNITLLDNNKYKDSSYAFIEGFSINENPDQPAVLYTNDCIPVPKDVNVSVELVDSSFLDFPIKLSPSLLPIISGVKSSDSQTRNEINSYDGLFPSRVVKGVDYQLYKGQSLLYVNVSPIQYDYKHQMARIFKEIKYKVKFDHPTNDCRFRVQQNKGDLGNFISNQRSIVEGTDVAQHYLIITVPEYIQAVEDFAEWKRCMGYNTHVVVKSSNEWNPDTIKQVARNKYLECDSLLSYMLIVGDNEDIPGESMSNYIYSTNFQGNVNYVTDHYYACIDDSVQTAFGGTVKDHSPEFHIGRLPVSTLAQAQTVINKIIKYEKYPVNDNYFYKTSLHLGYLIDNNNDGVEDLFDIENIDCSEKIRNYVADKNQMIDPNAVYTTSSTASSFYTCSGVTIPSSFFYDSWDNLQDRIINYIDEGAYYVLYSGHGDISYWDSPLFSTSNIQSLSNSNKLPIVFSSACLTGKYNGNECFAESFLKKDNGGCVAIFAASERAYSENTNVLMQGMFDALWPMPGLHSPYVSAAPYSMYHLGELLNWGKFRVTKVWNRYYSNNENSKYTFEIFHCFGDPSMMFITSNPTPFANVTLNRSISGISVTMDESGLITFYNKVSGEVISHYGNSATYSGEESNVTVCVSGRNKIPFIDESVIYVQNRTFSTNNTFKANRIYVGSNVTETKADGPVTFSSGKTKLIGNNIEIEGEVSVSLGAELEIINP